MELRWGSEVGIIRGSSLHSPWDFTGERGGLKFLLFFVCNF